jgi:hypothetical protein
MALARRHRTLSLGAKTAVPAGATKIICPAGVATSYSCVWPKNRLAQKCRAFDLAGQPLPFRLQGDRFRPDREQGRATVSSYGA